jgi:dihydroorotase-like cyclic amidohydrolase
MTEDGVHGPIDFVLLEFPDQEPTGQTAAALLDLVDSGTIRVYDIVAIRKSADGDVEAIEISTLPGASGDGFDALSGARSGLLGDDDVADAAEAMEPGTIAVLLVYENSWAIPFVRAAFDAGGQLIASARIPAEEVMAALDALEAAD